MTKEKSLSLSFALIKEIRMVIREQVLVGEDPGHVAHEWMGMV